MGDYDNLVAHVDSVLADVEEYARQIESGVYGRRQFGVAELDEDGVYVDHLVTVYADDEDDAYIAYRDRTGGIYLSRDMVDIVECHDNEFDEPTIVDDHGNETPISEWALSVEVKIGKPLQVWITLGGPNILIESEGYQNTRLEGHWWGQSVYRTGDAINTVFDYFVAYLYDTAPEEYK